MHPRRNTRFLLSVALAILAFLFSFATNKTCAQEGIILCRGDSVTLGATLLQNGTYGDPVPNQWVEFYEQTHNVFLGSAPTNASGIAEIQWTVPTSQPLGITTINATFHGNQSLLLSPSCQWAVLTILSHSSINIHVSEHTFAPGDVLSFTATLVNDRGDALPNAYVVVFCDGVQLKSGITNTSGQVNFAINCNTTWGQLGTNRIRVVHERDLSSFSEAVQAVFDISIQQLPSSLVLVEPPQNPIKLNENLQSCVLLETNGTFLSGVPLEVLFDGRLFGYVSTNQSGIACIRTPVDSRFPLGSHELALRFAGTSRYTSCFIGAQLSVVSPSLVKVFMPGLMIRGIQARITVQVNDLLGRPLSGALLHLHDLATDQIISQSILPDTVLVNIDLQVNWAEGARTFVLDITGNEYILNRSYSFGAVIWVSPQLSYAYSDIMGYACPGQEFLIDLHLGDSEHDYANTPVEVLIGNMSFAIPLTNQSGIFAIRFTAPKTSSLMNLLFIYHGNASEYRLAASISYTVVVTDRMPVAMQLYDYQTISPLQQIHVRLLIRALNGSFLVGVVTNYEWLSTRRTALSGPGGIAELFLPIPNQAGVFNLSYWIEASRFLLFSVGYTMIGLNPLDIASMEGAGIFGFALSACLSILAISIPAARRRYLLD